MSRCAGAGREQGQTDSLSWPVGIFHTIDGTLSLWLGVGQEAGGYLLLVFHELQLSLVREFKLFWEFHDFRVLFSGTGCELVTGW